MGIIDAFSETWIHVVAGPQAGASLRAPRRSTRIGDSAGDDVRLMGVGQERIEIRHDWASPMLGPKVAEGDAATAERVRGSQVFSLGPHRVQIAHRRHMRRFGAVAAAAVAGVWTATSLALAPAPAQGVSAVAGVAHSYRAPATPAEVRDAFERRLARDDLEELVQVRRARNEPTLIAEGVVPEARAGDWRAALAWFDARYASDTFLINMVTIADVTFDAPFRVTAIIGGASPRVRIASGGEFGVGDLMPGGWRVDAITGDSVELSRKDGRLRVGL